MSAGRDPSYEQRRQVVETFWEAFPPFWNQVRAHIRQVTGEQYDVSVEQFHILRHIRRGVGSVSELAAVRRISRAAVSQAVNALVAKELVTRHRDPRDRRYVQLELTSAGDALLDAIFADTRQWMITALAPLGDDELRTLALAGEALKKIEAG
jgi:DNA-binding MarR family transcriptional regulator